MKDALFKTTLTVALMFTFGTGNAAPPGGVPPGRPAVGDAASAGRGPEPAACRDVTPHKVRFVNVEPGVRLEVLDFGGARNARTRSTRVAGSATTLVTSSTPSPR